ncbi:hypothetical protein CMK11_08320 [Candidatus Poribacteria bacterium]|nr:hypothetical protein [Candidatus Poribacteria bacterium]
MSGVLRWLIQRIHSSSSGVTFQREFARRGAEDFSYIRIGVESIPDPPELRVNATPVYIIRVYSGERFDMLENDAGASLPFGSGLEAYFNAAKLQILLFGTGDILSPTVQTFYATPSSDL